jgi:hypothetical protein
MAVKLRDNSVLAAWPEVERVRGGAAQRRAIRQEIDAASGRVANLLTLKLQF